MNRRIFLKQTIGIVGILGAAAFVPITVPKLLPEEPKDVHVDNILTDISVKYFMENGGYVRNNIFPILRDTTTGNSPLNDIKLEIKRIEALGGAEPNTIVVGKEQYNFATKPENLGKKFPIVDTPLEHITKAMMQRREEEFMQGYYGTTTKESNGG